MAYNKKERAEKAAELHIQNINNGRVDFHTQLTDILCLGFPGYYNCTEQELEQIIECLEQELYDR